MNLKIIDWKYINIRGVNNLKISVEDKSSVPYKINLIMMPNGYGKTTTQILLRAIFDESAINWSREKVLSFRPPESKEIEGEFKATLLIDGSTYLVALKLNYQEGKAHYQTTRSGEIGGLENGLKLPSVLKSTFTTEFVKRFVFDGELAKEIIGSQSLEAERTIRYLYQLNRISDIKHRVDSIVTEKQRNMEKTNAKTEKGLARLKKEEEKFNTILVQLNNNKRRLEIEKEEKKFKLEHILEKISEHIKSDDTLTEQVESLEKERKNIDNEISTQTYEILNDIRDPFLMSKKVASNLNALSSKMQKLKLPRTMSKQFFVDLSNSESCVCGRAIGEIEKQNIIEKSGDFLGDDQIGVINAIKSSINGRVFSETVKEEIEKLNSLIIRRNELKNEWDRIQTERTEAGDIELQKLEIEKVMLEQSIDGLSEKLRVLTTKDKFEKQNINEIENISLCYEKLANIKEKIAEASDTVNLVKNSEKLKYLLTCVEQLTIEKLKSRIKNETNEKLSQIIKTERIEVEEIKGYLKLARKSGASEGQSLAIAYSFLGSMFETSSHDLPFIVDSPAGSLDLSVRRQVSRIIPNLFNQLIIFITSGEREGFTDYFYNIEEDVQFLTIFKENEKTYCIQGKEEFSTFQEEDENEKISFSE